LNCRYCGQWNPDTALRCSFCANAKDALEDATVQPRRSQVHSAEARIPAPPPGPLPSPLQPGQEPEFSRALRLADRAWMVVVGVVVVLLGLLYLLGRCS